MEKECKTKVMVEMLGGLLVGIIILTMTIAHAPALARLSNYNPQGLEATTLEEVLVLPDEEIDLATAILILSEEWDANFNVAESLEEINRMALEIRALINTEDDPERVISLINHYLFENEGYAYADYSSLSGLAMVEGQILPQVIKNRKGDCVGLSLLYLVLTERLGLPFYGVAVPGHFFVRYDNGQERINIETTYKGIRSEDSYYEKKHMLPPTYRKQNFYLRNLFKKEVIGVFLSNLGAAYTGEAMYDEAIIQYKKAVQINPNAPEVYTSLGTVYAHKGMYDEAIVKFIRAIEINPNDDSAYYNLGSTYARMEMYDEAIVEYKKAIEINPDFSEARCNLGLAYSYKGMYDEAIIQHKKAVKINPELAEAHLNLGIIYYLEGKYSLAIEHCDKAIALGERVHPEFLEALEPYQEK